jgi:hypothetical protein
MITVQQWCRKASEMYILVIVHKLPIYAISAMDMGKLKFCQSWGLTGIQTILTKRIEWLIAMEGDKLLYLHLLDWGWDSLVHTVTGLQMGWSRVWCLAGGRDYFNLQNSQAVSRVHSASYSVSNVGSFPGGNWPGIKLTIPLHLVPRLRKSRVIQVLLLLISWCVQGQLYLSQWTVLNSLTTFILWW